jgi:streptogramin lyase
VGSKTQLEDRPIPGSHHRDALASRSTPSGRGATRHGRPAAWSRAISLITWLLLLSACQPSGDAGTSPPLTLPAPTNSPATPPPTPTTTAGFADPIDVAVDRRGVVWVGNYADSTLQGFSPSDLEGLSGRSSSAPSIVVSEVGGPNQLLFDRRGTLWVAAWDRDAVEGYAAGSLHLSGEVRPAVTIRGRHLRSPTDLALDRNGDLWVAAQRSGEVMRYSARDIATGGEPRPEVVLQPFPHGTPEAIVVDLDGRLWVSNYDDNVIAVYEPSQIVRSGSPRPAGRLILPPLSGPIGLTVDRLGRVWVAEATANAIVVFASDARGRASPLMTLADEAIVMPHTVTFGPDGSMWVPCYNNTVLRFPARQLRTSDARPALILE